MISYYDEIQEYKTCGKYARIWMLTFLGSRSSCFCSTSRLNALRVANDRLRRECVRAHTDKGLKGEFKMALPIVKVGLPSEILRCVSEAKQVEWWNINRKCLSPNQNSKLKAWYSNTVMNCIPNLFQGYVVDSAKDWCSLFARSEPNFYRQIQVWMLGEWSG